MFLPITLIGFYWFNRLSNQASIAWLVLCSFFFYGWWDVRYLPLIAGSMIFNFIVGNSLAKKDESANSQVKMLLVFGITANLLLLCVFKYLDFIVSNINSLSNSQFGLVNLTLPLAISFFTFQQIAYLVDSFRGEAKEYSFLHYALFVSFFPQLIAGPIVHHKEMMPQFTSTLVYKFRKLNFVQGLTVFTIGWFKKSVIADGIAPYSNFAFDMALNGTPVSFFEAWGGVLAYTFQLYFDFSGYADMAVGAALAFNIRLPINFNSPYKACSITDFWRRWHITLSRFLRDYIYIPLGGNRKGKARRNVNLITTMLLGGIWHGAGWTFVFWGALHGFYLVVNNLWSYLLSNTALLKPHTTSFVYKAFSWILTFLCIVVGWVFFRAESFSAATNLLSGMVGGNGIVFPQSIAREFPFILELGDRIGMEFKAGIGLNFVLNYLWIMSALFISLTMPNTQQFVRLSKIDKSRGINSRLLIKLRWGPTQGWALVMGLLTVVATLSLTRVSEFLYFQF